MRTRALPAWLADLRGRVSARSMAAAAAVVVAVVVAGRWLLAAPAPPVELTLPRADGSPTGRPATSSAPAGSPAASPPGSPAAPVAGSTGTGPAGAPPGTIVVQVVGAVARPGVYRLPDGARVAALVDAAGGPTVEGRPDVLALAARLLDGDRVVVPTAAEVASGTVTTAPPSASATGAAAGGSRAGTTTEAAGPLDLNQATAAQLDTLPGVGPATAAAIIAHRERNGPFRSVEELLDVRGIGPAKLEGLRDLVTVS